jgi:hypothetical protein
MPITAELAGHLGEHCLHSVRRFCGSVRSALISILATLIRSSAFDRRLQASAIWRVLRSAVHIETFRGTRLFQRGSLVAVKGRPVVSLVDPPALGWPTRFVLRSADKSAPFRTVHQDRGPQESRAPWPRRWIPNEESP